MGGPDVGTADLERVTRGFVTPWSLAGDPQRLGGCVHRADGTKVALSERFGGHRGDTVHSVNPERIEPPADAPSLPGRGVYLGHYMGRHYGHFITETLSSFWIFGRMPAANFDYVLFHPFLFGEEVPGFVRHCLDAFGIAPEQVVFATGGAVRVESLLVPRRMMRLNLDVDPAVRRVYERLTAGLARPGPPTRRAYLSKRHFTAKRPRRTTANEVGIEALFRDRGFEIVYPEEMGFAEQMELYANAAVIAGLAGSALHNSLFMRPGARLIEIGDPRYFGDRSPTQALCDSVSGVEPLFIPFRGRRVGPMQTAVFDLGHLDAALAEAGLGAGRGRVGTAFRRMREAPEVLFRLARPSATALLRGTRERMPAAAGED